MHRFSVLIEACVAFMKSRIEDTEAEIICLMQDQPSSIHIKNLQALRLQYAVTAVGIFSIFEAELQGQLEAEDGFRQLRRLLNQHGKDELLLRFDLFKHAVNVLKHGEGRSYDTLREFDGKLPFRIKLPDQEFFGEGDCTETHTLVLADDEFVRNCAEIVHQVSGFIFELEYGVRDDPFRDNQQ
jgi:hypothetical protein